ncbi:MAG: translocation/assembly module TamB domain-containing protein [Candidatus Acidiferrales bacterium]
MSSPRFVRWSLYFLAFLIVVGLVTFGLYESGVLERWARDEIVQQLELRTGARVELGVFHLKFLRLTARAENLTLHGLESAGQPPLFHADRVDVGITILSLFHRQFGLSELVMDRPQLVVQFDKDGRSNLPIPKIAATESWRQSLFDLQIRWLELRDGGALISDRRVPLTAKGQNFEFKLNYENASQGAGFYVGNLQWKQVEIAEREDAPFRSDLSAKFALHRNAFELDEFAWKLPHSELNLRAELPDFSQPNWNFRYRARVSLVDFRTILRQPLVPDATVDFSGKANYDGRAWTTSGHYSAQKVSLPYVWFHASGIETWGDYDLSRELLVLPKFGIRALGGAVAGRLEMDLKTLAVRTETHLQGASLAAAYAAVDNPDFPVNTLHWDSVMDVVSVNTWTGAFAHFRSKGQSRWTAPSYTPPGITPAAAFINYDYIDDAGTATFTSSEISTPTTKIEFDGYLGGHDSALELKLNADDLVPWDDFINKLRGVGAVPAREAGDIVFRGRILGPIAGPTFVGHFSATNAHYDALYWDSIVGDLEYSLDFFTLTGATVRRGQFSAALNLRLDFDGDWSFVPSSHWSLDAKVERGPTADLQAVLGTNYPVTGLLSGTFHGSGTSALPILDADFVLDDILAKGYHFDRLGARLHYTRDEIQLSRAELRRDTGHVNGDVLYHPAAETAEFNLNGAGIALEKIGVLQKSSLPLGGQLQFAVRGHGPIRTPIANGNIRLVGLTVGADREGDFRAEVESDGRNAHVTVDSEMSTGNLTGQLDVELTGDELISGNLTVKQFDLNALITAALHLKDLTRPSAVNGVFTISGALRKPDTIEVKVNISDISFDYQFVQLQNDGPIQIVYRRNEVRIEQAHIHGPNTDMQLSGSARFDRDRPLHFNMSGGINLRFATGLIPQLEAQGQADVNASVEGTISKPRITGRANIRDASVHYSDFPVGLSHVNGNLVFDRSRLLFDRVTAESGGGQLTLSGSLSYSESPMRYEINAETPQVRVRYPPGMSWLIGGSLQLAGTPDAAILSGRIQVQRLLFAQGVDLASFFASSAQTGVVAISTSAFMRNLSFDLSGHTSAGARIEWGGAHVEIDGDLHLRGTWDRPVLLGHIHLLGGEMSFRGNNFTLTRGDINFANPFRLDPVLNIEATSVISQYQVTINFTGPASRLVLNYRSDPPLPDSDIVALLALGNTGQESALRSQSAGGQNYGATALLSEAISTGFGGRIEKLFGISQFRVDPFLAGTATESNAAARVTVVQQFSRDLTVTYSSNAASDQEQLIQVEYHLKRDVSIIFLRDINGSYALDIKFVKHFN